MNSLLVGVINVLVDYSQRVGAKDEPTGEDPQDAHRLMVNLAIATQRLHAALGIVEARQDDTSPLLVAGTAPQVRDASKLIGELATRLNIEDEPTA